jgi:hypothetical protein
MRLHGFQSASGCGGKDKFPHPLLVLLRSVASYVIDRAIPAPCGLNKDILIGSGEEHLNFYQPCIWNRHEHFHATFYFNLIVINLKNIYIYETGPEKTCKGHMNTLNVSHLQ